MYVQPKGGKFLVPGSYKLAYVRVVATVYSGIFCLNVYAPTKSFILQFASADERDSWSLAIQDAIVNARAQSGAPSYKEAPIWIPDIASDVCMACGIPMTFYRRKHHCRNCGKIMCRGCLPHKVMLPHISETRPSKICQLCFEEVEKEHSQPNCEQTIEPRRGFVHSASLPILGAGQRPFPGASDDEGLPSKQ
jgi:hypothetical protein